MSKVKLYAAYDVLPRRGAQGDFGPSLTQQQFVDQCNINTLVERFHKTGDPRLLNSRGESIFADLVGLPTYQESLNRVIQAEEAFMKLPALARKRFRNDPHEFLAFIGDQANYDEALKMGLVDPKKAEARKAAAAPPAAKTPAEPSPAPPGAQVKGA